MDKAKIVGESFEGQCDFCGKELKEEKIFAIGKLKLQGNKWGLLQEKNSFIFVCSQGCKDAEERWHRERANFKLDFWLP